MAAFSYLAVDASGRRRRGVMQAESRRACRQALRREGLFPLEVREVARRERRRFGRRGLSAATLAVVTRQLALLVGSGSTVEESVAAIAAEMDDRLWPRVLGAVRSSLLEGRSLADALEETGLFPPVYVAGVRAGEAGGSLGESLEILADHLEAGLALKNRLTAAMVYPLILVLVSVGVVVFLLARVVPQVAGIFKGLHRELPPLTRALMAVGDLLAGHGVALLLAALVLAVAAAALVRLRPVRFFLHSFVLRLPLFGNLVRKVNSGRYLRTLGMLVKSGVPLYEAMSSAAAAVKNPLMTARLGEAAVRVREGGGLRDGLAASGFFTATSLQLVAAGERSGELDRMLLAAAKGVELEVERSLAMMMAVVEPALILAVGGLVLFIVLAVMLPVFDLNRMVG